MIGRFKSIGAYGSMLAATVVAFLVLQRLGAGLTAPARTSGTPFGAAAASQSFDVLPRVLLALVAVVVASRLAGALFRYVHQPAVIGEVIAGIFLGPSVLGQLAPAAQAYILPAAVGPYLGILAQIGIILFMFLVGLELDTTALGKKTHATVAISHASIVAPFVLGSTLALFLYPRVAYADVPFTVFALFMGVSMSITAFPVLARILRDRGMRRTHIGMISVTCAAVDDVSAWCLLALVVSVARATPSRAVITIALSLAYLAVMFVVVQPFVARIVRASKVTDTAKSVMLVALLLSSLATEWIGVHAVFGAFVLGAIVPHDSLLARSLAEKVEDLVVILFLPAFFAFTGMRTEIGLLDGAESWLICLLIVVAACLGKFGGSYAAARLTGLDRRDAAILGTLMNTRGLMELIVLNIGLDLGVISPKLFAIMVIMALVTTFMTTPVLHLLTRRSPLEELEPVEEVHVRRAT